MSLHRTTFLDYALGLRLLLVALGLCFLASCSKDEGPPRHLLLIVIDTLRGDALDKAGLAAMGLPAAEELRTFARKGGLFRNAFSQAPWTPPSFASLLTSRYPSTIGFSADGLAFGEQPPRIREEDEPLASKLRRAGFETTALVAGGQVSSRYGFDIGFDQWLEVERTDGSDIDAVLTEAQSFLDRNRDSWNDSRFALLLHTYEVHGPNTHHDLLRDLGEDCAGIDSFKTYDSGIVLPKEFAEVEDMEEERRKSRCLYLADVLYTSRRLGEFLNRFERDGLLRDTLVIIVADHGETLFERILAGRGRMHGHHLQDELLHVPWIVVGRGIQAGTEYDELVELIDVLPTALELLGVEPTPNAYQGRSHAKILRGLSSDSGRDIAFSEAPYQGMGAATLRTKTYRWVEMTGGDQKPPDGPRGKAWWDAIKLPSTGFFGYGPTRKEKNLDANNHAQKIAKYRSQLEHFRNENLRLRRPAVRQPSIDESTRKELEAMGYLGE